MKIKLNNSNSSKKNNTIRLFLFLILILVVIGYFTIPKFTKLFSQIENDNSQSTITKEQIIKNIPLPKQFY